MNKINIFILAAGLGERLRPITSHIPKPLIPVLGKPVIERILDKISHLPFDRIGINLHYRKEAVEEWTRSCSLNEKIVLFPEEKILGTGGALKNAEQFLKEGPFLVHNSDVLSDIDLRKLLEHHCSSGNLVTLAIHDYPKFNTVVVDKNGNLMEVETGLKPVSTGMASKEGHKCAFTGIAVYEPGFLDFLPYGKSSVVDAWLKAVSEGLRIGTFDITGSRWSDIGTPDAYAAAVFEMLRREGETLYIHPSVKQCGKFDIQGNVVLEEDFNEGGLHATPLLRNCIILPGSNVGALHATPLLENCIIGPDFRIELNEREALPFADDGKQLIGTGGSDRKYYRIKKDGISSVFMQCREDDPDYERHIEYTRFFLGHSVPVPKLFEADAAKKNAIIEDAGDISLYSWLKCPRDGADTEDIYRQVLDIISLVHTSVTDDVSSCPLLKSRTFDYDHFRWETDYFIKRFVEGVRNIRSGTPPGLDEELHELAVKADSVPKTVVHRDFQSQNIMVMKGPELRLIDYQGARMGPPAYDLASMLWDPYYRLEDGMRGRLLDYYIDKMKAHSSDKFHEGIFRSSLVLCRLQRHMQALGAYGFLSMVKGKKHFQKYMPEGVRLLRADVRHARDDYPELYKLISGM